MIKKLLSPAKYCICSFLICLACTAFAQNTAFDLIERRVDSLIETGLPKSALTEVDKLGAQAKKSNNPEKEVKATLYRLLLQSYLEEDAFAKIISGLNATVQQSQYPAKPVLQSLLAEMYWRYYQQNRYKISQRSKLDKPSEDFALWDLQTIIDETANLYKLSLADAKRQQSTPVSILNGALTGDEQTRYLRPALYDFLVHRAFDFFLNEEANITKPKEAFTLNNEDFFNVNSSFGNLPLKTPDTTSTEYNAIKLLQQATLFRMESPEPEALADLTVKRLNFIYRKSQHQQKDSLYLNSLKTLSGQFSNKPINADILVSIAQFHQQKDSLKTAYAYLKRAEDLYRGSFGATNANWLIKQIKFKEVNIGVEDINLPQKPILAQLGFRNVTDVDFKLYKLTDAQLKEINEMQGKANSHPNNNHINPTQELREYFKQQAFQKNWQVKLPDTGDFRKHSTEFKIAPLNIGNYILIADGPDSSDNLASIVQFKITGLVYIARVNPNNTAEIRVMDRDTGLPIEKASVIATQWKYENKEWKDIIVGQGKTDKNGKFEFRLSEPANNNNQNLAIKLSFNGDEFTDGEKYFYRRQVNNDDGYDETTIFFTDRQIYRPGQTVYFKALQISRSKERSSVIPDREIDVELQDANNKTIASQKLTTNEFGSISGSFILPQNTLNGQFSLFGDDGQINFKVEEYKRPTFTVNFNPIKETYHFNDSITVKGKVLAYSGYGLSNAKVSYKITRSATAGDYRLYTGIKNGRPTSEIIDISSATIFTDKNGEFAIPFKAAVEKKYWQPGSVYTYTIEATVTDASGETKFARSFVTVGNEVLRVQALIAENLPAADSLIIPVSLSNLNNQLQKGKITARVYSLKQQKSLFKSRLWAKPDIFIMGKEEYQQYFNEYAYKDEDEKKGFVKDTLIAEKTITITEDQPAYLKLEDFANHPTAKYLIELFAENEQGDTCSARYYTTLITDKPGSFANSNWAILRNNHVKKGEDAVFILGIDTVANVFMEVFEGNKPVLSKWMVLKKGQNKIEVPFSGNQNMQVQFLAINSNRSYSFSTTISEAKEDENIPLRFTTFRNKLEPGQKEQWKIQVGGYNNEKQGVEMVAALYDASLNDISPSQNWMNKIQDNEYNTSYFFWNAYSISNLINSAPFVYRYPNYTIAGRGYERLDMMGYNYYGGYNNAYRDYVKRLLVSKRSAEILEKMYQKSAARFKDGFDVKGRITDEGGYPLPGVSIAIKGTKFITLTGTDGKFKLRVPKNAVLEINYIGFGKQEIVAQKGKQLIIKLKEAGDSLSEVVVVGYGTQSKSNLTASVSEIRLRGASTLAGKAAGLAINEAVGEAPTVEALMVKDNSIRDFASVEVMGRPFPFMPKPQKEISLRKNFNETAFFYPQLRTNEKGEMLIDFTIPETLTRWQFKSFAHTKGLKSGYLEAEIVTQKQLSISANIPRFFRENDTITVSARLVNLTAKTVKGNVEIKFFNGLTMQPISLLWDKKQEEQGFELEASSTKPVSFKLVVPQNLEAITYRLTADAGRFTDGEENTIPVLPNRMMVTESMPVMVRGGQTKTFTFDKLINNSSQTLENKNLTLEFTQNPAWYAVQALPYLMEFPYECSEQIFSRYYANSLSGWIVAKMPQIKTVFDKWKGSSSKELLSNLEKNQELKSVLLEETPWVKQAQNETDQKKRIALLFDLNKMDNEKQLNAEKLAKMQLPSGAFGWFTGSRYEDRYITQHILAGIGQLTSVGAVSQKDEELQKIALKALNYLDNRLIADYLEETRKPKSGSAYNITAHGWYARSYFKDKPMSAQLKKALAWHIEKSKTEWKLQSVYVQAMISLTMLRYQHEVEAKQIIRSLKERAQNSDELGMYWPKNTLGYFWHQSPIETQSLLIELFSEAKGEDNSVEEMKIWLLRNKQTNNWKTTKATAAACYAVLLRGNDMLPEENEPIVKLGEKDLSILKPGLKKETGTGYIKTSWINDEVKPQLGMLEVQNTGKSLSWGAMHWQYLENLDKITSATNQLKLGRKYYYQSSDSKLIEITANALPKTGDQVKVVVYLTADRDYEYVHLKDMRPSGTEPENILSGYKYREGFYYYEVTKDVATNFFISYLPKGKYVFEYNLRVTQPGNFSSGITQIQSMYAPEFNAHSQGQRITFLK